jgi:hypothetical protein
MDLTAGWPLDSTIFRFARDEIAMGDTVELYYRRYYADGEAEPGRTPLNGIFKREGKQTRDMLMSSDIIGRPDGTEVTGPNYERYVWLTRNPGEVVAVTTSHGRELRAHLRVTPATGRPPHAFYAIRPPPSLRLPQPTAGCFSLAFGETSPDTSAYPGMVMDTAMARRTYELLPHIIALDSAPVIRALPAAGRQIHALGGERLQIGRYWQGIGRDSVRILWSTHDSIPPNLDVHIDARMTPGGLKGSMYRGVGVTEVRGTRVGC